MTFELIKQGAKQAANTALASLKAAKPEIFVGVGIVGVGVAAVMACVATATKTDEALEEAKTDLEIAREVKKSVEEGPNGESLEFRHGGDGEPYTEKDAKRVMAAAYFKTAKRFIKIYGPSALVFGLSVASILYGHGVLKARHAAAVATAAGLKDTLKEYRSRVAGEIGEDNERMLYNGSSKKAVKSYTVNEETGEVSERMEEREVADADRIMKDDPYCYLWDEATTAKSGLWSKAPGVNYSLLCGQLQPQLNDYLRRRGPRGWVELNTVLERIGLEPDPNAIGIGWVNDPSCEGCIDFGLVEELERRGLEEDPGCFYGGVPSYWLHFNCDGNINNILTRLKAEDAAKRAMKRAERRRHNEDPSIA